MKDSKDDQQATRDLLARWQVPPGEDPSFHSSVWSQIECSEAASGATIPGRLLAGLERFFSSTAATLSAGASMVALSLGAAHLHAQSALEKDRHLAEINYLEAIYPVFSPTPSAP